MLPFAALLLIMQMPLLAQAKLAKLRRELLDPQSAMGGGGGGGGRGEGFDVNKVGDARIGLVGKLMAVILQSCGRFLPEHWR
jgi:ribosome-interacting GTPase 1